LSKPVPLQYKSGLVYSFRYERKWTPFSSGEVSRFATGFFGDEACGLDLDPNTGIAISRCSLGV
jgi:hypothetical protein